MGTELVAPVLGLVVVCLIGIIGGAFLVSWLKEVLQKEWNKKYKKSPHGKNSQKQASDPYSNIYGTAPNIYQCRTCTNKILLQGDDTVVDLEPSLPDRDTLPNTSRAGQSEYRNPNLINHDDPHGSPNESKMYRTRSHETLLDIRPGSPVNDERHKVSYRPTKKGERTSNVRSDNLTRYESILKINAARGPTGWTIVRQKDSDDENIPVKGTGIRSSLSWSDLTSSSPHSTNEYPGMKNKPYAVARKGGSFEQPPLPAQKMYYDYQKPESISYVYDPRQDTLLGRNSPTPYGGNKHPMQMANRSKLVEQVSHGGIRGRVPADSAYHAHYQQLKPNNSDSLIRNNSPSNVSSFTPKRSNNPTKSEIDFIDIDNLPLPPPPPMDDDEPALPKKRENLNPPPSVSPSDDEPVLPSYEESIKDSQPINVSNRSTPTLTPPTPYC